MRFGGGGHEGFFNEDVFPAFEGGLGEREMRVWGGGDYYDVDYGVGEHGVCGVIDLRGGMVFGGIVGGFGGSLHDGMKNERGGNED